MRSLALIGLIIILSSIGCGAEVDLCGDHPRAAVILIVDGLGAPYVLPGLTPYAIDGTELPKANWPLQNVAYVRLAVPIPSTAPGHAVLVTGYSSATPEVVGFNDSTIYDAARQSGFVIVGVMEKGDFAEQRCEQDIILYAPTASIIHPEFKVDTRRSIVGLEFDTQGPEYSEAKGIDRYALYNRWAIDQAIKALESLNEGRFILTINVGGVDGAGHYYCPEEYVRVIDSLWSDIERLKAACDEDVVLIVTSDHGMAFDSNYSRGGHSGERYRDKEEANMAPFILFSGSNGVIGEYGLEDAGPTILDLLGVATQPAYADGESMGLSGHHRLTICTDSTSPIQIQGPKSTVLEGDQEYVVFLPPGVYELHSSEGNLTIEVNGSTGVTLGSYKEDLSRTIPINSRLSVGLASLLAINGTGTAAILLIRRGRI